MKDTMPSNYPVTSVSSVLKGLTFAQAESPVQIAQARELFLEYAQSLGFSLCFQNFDNELAGLPGDYVLTEGRLLLAEFQGELAGCVALHNLEAGICEMKRLYLRPRFVAGVRDALWPSASLLRRGRSAIDACALTPLRR